MLCQFSGWKNKFKESNQQLCSLIVCSAYFWALKMEAVGSYETSVDLCYTTRRHIPEDHRCDPPEHETANHPIANFGKQLTIIQTNKLSTQYSSRAWIAQ
jgi:hypothetical protein